MKATGGPAFGAFKKVGLTIRDWFATFAPEPTQDEIKTFLEQDRLANSHGDSYKPRRRSIIEIVTMLRYTYADAMLVKRDK